MATSHFMMMVEPAQWHMMQLCIRHTSLLTSIAVGGHHVQCHACNMEGGHDCVASCSVRMLLCVKSLCRAQLLLQPEFMGISLPAPSAAGAASVPAAGAQHWQGAAAATAAASGGVGVDLQQQGIDLYGIDNHDGSAAAGNSNSSNPEDEHAEAPVDFLVLHRDVILPKRVGGFLLSKHRFQF
jgi:hypothetical protein